MLKQIWEAIPHRLFYFLVIGLVISYLGSFVLNYLTNLNQRQIDELKNEIENIKSRYSEQISNEAYQALMQFLSLKYLIDNKKSILPLLQQPPRYLPKFTKINSVALNNNTDQVNLTLQVEGWVNYARMIKYFESQDKIFKNFKLESYSFDPATGIISANISFIFNRQ